MKKFVFEKIATVLLVLAAGIAGGGGQESIPGNAAAVRRLRKVARPYLSQTKRTVISEYSVAYVYLAGHGGWPNE